MVQDRVLNEMLGSIQDTAGRGWKVLVLDSTTTRILSAAMRMSDILEAGAGLCAWSVEYAYHVGNYRRAGAVATAAQQLNQVICPSSLQNRMQLCATAKCVLVT